MAWMCSKPALQIRNSIWSLKKLQTRRSINLVSLKCNKIFFIKHIQRIACTMGQFSEMPPQPNYSHGRRWEILETFPPYFLIGLNTFSAHNSLKSFGKNNPRLHVIREDVEKLRQKLWKVNSIRQQQSSVNL